eukprot:scaffold2784_cov109-Cylindrotheca_fusiformis.AAC.12
MEQPVKTKGGCRFFCRRCRCGCRGHVVSSTLLLASEFRWELSLVTFTQAVQMCRHAPNAWCFYYVDKEAR